jgi:hypothetical protein
MSPFTLIDVPQRSPEWFAARLGRVTGSRAADVLASIKSGEAAARRDYRWQLVCERLTGLSSESTRISDDMQWGIDHEDEAIAALEAQREAFIQRTGFLQHAELMAGASLDGHIGYDVDEIVEVKCPKTATHVRTLRDGRVPPEHLAQITHNVWLTGATMATFASYDPRMPERLRLFVARINAANLDLAGYDAKVRAFLAEVDREMEALQTMADPFARMGLQ